MRLDHLNPGDEARIISLEGGYGLQQRLNRLGLHPGDTLRLVARGAFRGPLLILIHGTRIALGRGVARRVVVEPFGAHGADGPHHPRRGRHHAGR